MCLHIYKSLRLCILSGVSRECQVVLYEPPQPCPRLMLSIESRMHRWVNGGWMNGWMNGWMGTWVGAKSQAAMS